MGLVIVLLPFLEVWFHVYRCLERSKVEFSACGRARARYVESFVVKQDWRNAFFSTKHAHAQGG